MKAIETITGRVSVLNRDDVDTDQIMPKQFLKRIERTGFGEFLFFDWAKSPDFELNRPEFLGAKILLAGRNFGCGSSREHAPWGLQQFGGRELTVDLETQTIEDPSGELTPFPFDAFERHRLLNGLDDIGLTLEHEADIAAFEAARAS